MESFDPKIKPHYYWPSILHMGDCHVCGHVQNSPIHLGKEIEMTEPQIHPPMPEWLESIHHAIYKIHHNNHSLYKRIRITITPQEWLEYKQYQRDMGYCTATRAINGCPIDIVSGEPEIMRELF